MIATEIEYEAPRSVADAIRALGSAAETKVIAGGHSLLPLMKLGLARPTKLVDIGKIEELTRIDSDPTGITIGARVTHETLAQDPLVAERLTALADAAGEVGDMQVRGRGTIGGSLAHADPAADEPAVVLAFDATITAAGRSGTRSIPAREFFTGPLETALRPDEILVGVTFPIPAGRSGSAYVKFPHPASRFAVVGVAALVTLRSDGAIAAAQIAVTGAADHPYRATATERALAGVVPKSDAIAAAAARAAEGATMLSDLVAETDYRAHLVTVYARRAIELAARRAA